MGTEGIEACELFKGSQENTSPSKLLDFEYVGPFKFAQQSWQAG